MPRSLGALVLVLLLFASTPPALAQTTANFFIFTKPAMPQGVVYGDPPVFVLPSFTSVPVAGLFRRIEPSSTGGPAAPAPTGNQFRFTVDGEPVSEWMAGCGASATTPCAATIDTSGLALGSHWLSIQQQGPEVVVAGVPFYIGTPASGPQDVYYGPVLYDVAYSSGAGAREPFTAHYPGAEPSRPGFPYGPRPAVPWTVNLPSSQLWAQRMTTEVGALAFPRRFSLEDDGRVTIRNDGLFYYYIFDSLNEPMSGGPRNVAVLAHVTDLEISTDDGTAFGISGQGFLWRVTPAGDADILAGWRPKGQTDRAASPGHVHHAATWQIGSTQPAPGSSNHRREWFGLWVDGGSQSRRLDEPWGISRDVADDDNPDRIQLGGQHRWYVANTRGGNIVLVDHYLVHNTPAGLPRFSVVAGSLTGTLGCVDGIGTGARLGAPWNIKYSALTGLYYFTDYLCHAIRSFNPVTRQVATLVRSAVLPPWPFGVFDAFYGTVVATGQNPATYHADGPPGTARLLSPQGMDIDSTGRYVIFGQRPRGVPAVRKVDVLTGEVTTLAKMPGGATARDMHVAVNKDGTVGPLDDILVTSWDTHRRFSSTGASKGRIFEPASGAGRVADGPASLHRVAVGGAGPLAVGGGSIWIARGGSEGLYRFTTGRAGDPVFNLNKIYYGRIHYINAIGMRYGVFGQDQLGGPTIDELSAQYDDGELLARLIADNPDVAAYSDTQRTELLCFTRWLAMAGSEARGYDWASCASPPPPAPVPPEPPPSGTITSPASFVQVSGVVTITLEVSDNVSQVRLWLDHQRVVASSATAPFTMTWDSGETWTGWHSLVVQVLTPTGSYDWTNGVSVQVVR